MLLAVGNSGAAIGGCLVGVLVGDAVICGTAGGMVFWAYARVGDGPRGWALMVASIMSACGVGVGSQIITAAHVIEQINDTPRVSRATTARAMTKFLMPYIVRHMRKCGQAVSGGRLRGG